MDNNLSINNAGWQQQTRLLDAWIKSLKVTDKKVQLLETHISWIVLTEKTAYKIKKALKFDFLDFTELETRHFYCQEEIRLNKRTAPQIYQKVIHIGGSIENPETGAQPVLEYAVRMRRFVQENEMGKMLQAGKLQSSHIASLAENMALFHNSLPRLHDETEKRYGTFDAVSSDILQNYTELKSLYTGIQAWPDLEKLAACECKHIALLKRQKEKIRWRHQNGFIRECHGDLHSGNIVFIHDKAVLFDCIEFNPDFRFVDMIRDLAFTFIDLIYYDKPEFAWLLLNIYLEKTGDYDGVSLLWIYGALHALVRAKVTVIRSVQTHDQDEHAKLIVTSRKYLAVMEYMLRARHPGIVITCGMPGSGKSTFSLVAISRLHAVRIRSDIERKRLFGLEPLQSSSDMSMDIYNETASRATYRKLHELTSLLTEAGFVVIVDAAFLKIPQRMVFQELSSGKAYHYVIAFIHSGFRTIMKRIQERKRQNDDPSEADYKVFLEKRIMFEELTEQEKLYTVEFQNEEGYDFNEALPEWQELKKRLALS